MTGNRYKYNTTTIVTTPATGSFVVMQILRTYDVSEERSRKKRLFIRAKVPFNENKQSLGENGKSQSKLPTNVSLSRELLTSPRRASLSLAPRSGKNENKSGRCKFNTRVETKLSNYTVSE